MKTYGSMHPTDGGIPQPPDTVNTLLIAGSSGQAMDWPAGTEMARFSGTSTAGASLNFQVNPYSTSCAAPSSGSVTSSTGAQMAVTGTREFQIPGNSTGYSVAALSSGYIVVECWAK